jgi:hypothetical protein
LRELGLLNNKHIPAAYFRASEQQRRALLAGLLDTDGWCEKAGNCRFAVTSKQLAEDFRRLLATLGKTSTTGSRPAKLNGKVCGTAYEVRFYTSDPVFRMPRKVRRQVGGHKPSNRRRFIVDIRPIESVPVRCITVDSPNSLYLVGEQCIPTHNTFSVRLLLLAAALDPLAELHVFDMKGTGDFSALEPVAHAYRAGDDADDIEYALADLRALSEELRRRTKVIRTLPRDLCPESKITPELAGKRALRLHPIVLAADECFPAGTLVGDVPIEQLKPGDLVPSWDELTGLPCQRPVQVVMRNRPAGLVRVWWANGTSLVCTPGHPFMTADGWCQAGALTESTEVLTYAPAQTGRGGAVHYLRDGVRADHEAAAVLAEDRPGVLLAAVQPRRMAAEYGGADGSVRRSAGCDLGEDDREQPDARPCRAGEDGRHAAQDRTPASAARRERPGTDGAATPTGRGTRLGDGGSRPDRAGVQGTRAADALQAGHRAPDVEGRGGDRRRLALLAGPPRAGSAEGSVPTWRRVDRVEVLQPGSDGRYGGVCPDGHVYNLEVADTHTYQVAGGVVVHNCQRWMEHPDHGKELTELAEDLVRRGPAVGIMAIFATQRPDARSLPTGISGNAILRYCLRVMGHTANDQVLGTSAH